MLPKQNRANPAEINLVREEGKLIPGSLFSLLVSDLKNQNPSRFAFIVSTKIDKRATRRNQAKRSLRLAVNFFLNRIKRGKIILFLTKKKILDQDLETIKKEVKTIFEKTGLIENFKGQNPDAFTPEK